MMKPFLFFVELQEWLRLYLDYSCRIALKLFSLFNILAHYYCFV